MAGYTRQSAAAIAPGAVIRAAHSNLEFTALAAAFDAATGHAHDGSTGNGPALKPTALSGVVSEGFVARISATAFAPRTLTGTANQIAVANGNGVAGNPTISLPSAVTFPGSVVVTTTLTTGGNVGIGTASPTTRLHVAGGRSSFYAANEQYAILVKHGDSALGAFIGSPATGGLVISGEGGNSQFTINTSGNVGIGTTNPTARLNVVGGYTGLQYDHAGLNYLDIVNVDTTANAGVITRFITQNSTNTGATTVDLVKYNSGAFTISNNDAAGSISLGTAGVGRFHVTSSGNVGIGTTNPATRLDVSGTVTATAFSGPVTGNASTATTLQTARAINGVSFNGSTDITVADSTKLPLTGGTVSGALTVTGTLAGNVAATGATASRSLAAHFADSLSVRDFGAVGDGATDDTTAFQGAVTYCQSVGKALFIPAGTYRLTSPINITRGITICGEGVEHTEGDLTNDIWSRGRGTWLHFDHAGIGFYGAPAGGVGVGALTGVAFKHFGTMRTQPTPAPGWTPTVYDWDFAILGQDFYAEDILIRGSYRGMRLHNRVECRRVRGQTFDRFIFLEFCSDTPRLVDCHFWPFWSVSEHVSRYMLANSIAYSLARADNTSMVGCFAFGPQTALYCYSAGSLPPYNLRLVNCDFDYVGRYGILVDTNADQCAISIANTQIQHAWASLGGAADSVAIEINGTNCALRVVNLISVFAGANVIRIQGTGSFAQLSNIRVHDWNYENDNHEAFAVTPTNTLQFSDMPKLSGGNGAPILGSGGTVTGLSLAGNMTGTTDVNGDIGVAHNFGMEPTAVLVTASSIDPLADELMHAQVYSKSSTQVTFRYFKPTGARKANENVRLSYLMQF